MGHGPVKIDPAIERFNTMRETAYMRFTWTPRTVRTFVIGFIAFPAAIYYLADKHHLRWDQTGKRKGESLLRTPPA